jgi:N-acetyl sugar amidotransferase
LNNTPEIKWCSRCVAPSSSAIPLSFNDDNVCSACQVYEQKKEIDWDERLEILLEGIEPYRKTTGYECIIPVSGGKDSYFQTHFVIEKLGLKPLLVTYNGNNFLDVGWRNMMRMKEVFNVDHIVVSPSIDLIKRMNRIGFTMLGDMNWQNHCGIFTVPIQVAVNYSIPLIFWGEHGWTDLGGMLSMHDFPEFTYRYRVDQGLRGYDWQDFIGNDEEPIDESELECFKYPKDEDIQRVGVRGLYIGNFDPWDSNSHTQLVIDKYGWEQNPEPFERTYRRTSNLDDRYENGVHDYLKYIKFGYGRATDHACKDIRSGYMTREEGIEMIRKYDHVRSSDLYHWLDYINRDEEWFDKIADSFRSKHVWTKDTNGKWIKQNIWNNKT